MRVKRVAFADKRVKKAFDELRSGRFEEKRLAEFIEDAIGELKENPFAGAAIPRRLWPAVYVKKYGIDNLRKYNLPNAWRLAYTLKGNEVEIISIILEWFDHEGYEKRFGYKKR
ncbi:hypothetical protein COU38_00930 [Candidatus Micrarchaeota archaeon CG10_big_fil_rev_8_21_14_0_10_54_18]|nr:MAG: hypothetical protein AUJ15_03790 [Candidatus Micrarchaeota archaeon CG1_02_55_41]PIO02649.1 MAG: hypothetical protein COT57_03010 [Candidatus Micrarchaeota archaeon CG09_land_8_20_14_0_10_55_25]PJD01481.1 MAG: hypothetical protein COU38_00930 [Candidatus Micrarchaeota archaeon CG10_big_fil_rev_8_21_14_0_10_54_18]